MCLYKTVYQTERNTLYFVTISQLAISFTRWDSRTRFFQNRTSFLLCCALEFLLSTRMAVTFFECFVLLIISNILNQVYNSKYGLSVSYKWEIIALFSIRVILIDPVPPSWWQITFRLTCSDFSRIYFRLTIKTLPCLHLNIWKLRIIYLLAEKYTESEYAGRA